MRNDQNRKILERTLTRLGEGKRWSPLGPRSGDGRVCLLVALGEVTREMCDNDNLVRPQVVRLVRKTIRDEYGVYGVSVFNDLEETTWGDVERVLEKTISSLS